MNIDPDELQMQLLHTGNVLLTNGLGWIESDRFVYLEDMA